MRPCKKSCSTIVGAFPDPLLAHPDTLNPELADTFRAPSSHLRPEKLLLLADTPQDPVTGSLLQVPPELLLIPGPSVQNAFHTGSCYKQKAPYGSVPSYTFISGNLDSARAPCPSLSPHFRASLLAALPARASVHVTLRSPRWKSGSLHLEPPCTLKLGYMVPNSGYLGPNRG